MAEDGDDATGADDESTVDTDHGDDAYRGVFGAIPYSYRASDSRLFKTYAVLGALAAAGVTVVFVLATVSVFAATTGGRGGTFSFSRAFFVFVGLLIVGPLLAPILSVARRHRRGAGEAAYDQGMSALGMALLVSLYTGLIATVPPEQQQPYDGVFEPYVSFLYDLPQVAGLVFPALVTVGILLYHRYYGRIAPS